MTSVRQYARLAVILGAGFVVAGSIAAARSGRPVQAWSIGTAYSAIFLTAYALAIGPLNVIRGRANPVHSVLRRDVGIGAGLMSIGHTLLGLQVHAGGSLSRYFLAGDGPSSTKGSLFLAANWMGLAAVVIFGVVTLVSNNPSLRRLGLATWKTIQRLVYPAAILAALHGFAYQALEKRAIAPIVLISAISAAVLVLQLTGRRIRLNESRSSVSGT